MTVADGRRRYAETHGQQQAGQPAAQPPAPPATRPGTQPPPGDTPPQPSVALGRLLYARKHGQTTATQPAPVPTTQQPADPPPPPQDTNTTGQPPAQPGGVALGRALYAERHAKPAQAGRHGAVGDMLGPMLTSSPNWASVRRRDPDGLAGTEDDIGTGLDALARVIHRPI